MGGGWGRKTRPNPRDRINKPKAWMPGLPACAAVLRRTFPSTLEVGRHPAPPARSPPERQDALLGEQVQGEGVDAFLVDHHKAPALASGAHLWVLCLWEGVGWG